MLKWKKRYQLVIRILLLQFNHWSPFQTKTHSVKSIQIRKLNFLVQIVPVVLKTPKFFTCSISQYNFPFLIDTSTVPRTLSYANLSSIFFRFNAYRSIKHFSNLRKKIDGRIRWKTCLQSISSIVKQPSSSRTCNEFPAPDCQHF